MENEFENEIYKNNNALKYINNYINKKIEDSNNKVNSKIIDELKKNNDQLNQRIDKLESMLHEILKENTKISPPKKETKKEIESMKKHELIKKEETIEKEESIQKYEHNKNEIKNYYHELKVETFDFDDIFIKKCLDMHNINGDILLFQKMYIDDTPKEYYPIRNIKKKFQYWADGHMNDDNTNGLYICDIILKNIETCYLKINVFDNYSTDTDLFLSNQEHIYNLSELKYKEKFLSKITQIIN
jgi:hypothetical protein